MSVLKRKRKQSQFEVFHHLYQTRREITDYLLRDFGYNAQKAEGKLLHRLGIDNPETMTENQREQYEREKRRNEAFAAWFIKDERQVVVDCLREITKEVFLANSIYPTIPEELARRRLHQDEAIGQCYRLIQELQYAIETLPVNVNTYTRFAEMLQTQANLIKGWRKSDNKFQRALSESAANFANANSNGNCNANNASNANGVRPDFGPAVK